MAWRRPTCLFVYFVLLLLAAADAYLLNDRFGYTPLIFLILLLPADLICAVRARRCVRVRSLLARAETNCGEKTAVRYSVENTDMFLLCRLRVSFRMEAPGNGRPEKIKIYRSLAPQSEYGCRLSVIPGHIGMYCLKTVSVTVCGPIGLFSRRIHAPQPVRIVSVPCAGTASLSVDDAKNCGEEDSPRSGQGKENDEYDGAREYLPGDPLHRVHWKLTAHRGTMMTRAETGEKEDYAAVAADLRPGPGTVEQAAYLRDRLCEDVFGELFGCVLHGRKARLIFMNGAELCEFRVLTEDDLENAAFCLAAAAPCAHLPAGADFGSTTVLLSVHPDAELFRAAAKLSETGTELFFRLILPAKSGPESLPLEWDGLKKRGVNCLTETIESPAQLPKKQFCEESSGETEAQA